MRLPVFLFALICLCVPAHAQGVVATPDLSRIGEPRVDVVAMIGERYPDTLALLAREFPDDHRGLMSDLGEIGQQDVAEDAMLLLAYGRFTELRRKYADRLRFAPTEAHAAMLGHLAILYDLVFKTEGPQVCGRFARDGTVALVAHGLSEIYAKAIDQQSVVFFDAVVRAIETPEPSEPVRQEDWGAVFNQMIGAGAPSSFVATISGGNPNDPNLCPALAAMLFTSSIMDTPEGERTRADFARNLVGY